MVRSYCDYWANERCTCTSNFEFMAQNCPGSCRFTCPAGSNTPTEYTDRMLHLTSLMFAEITPTLDTNLSSIAEDLYGNIDDLTTQVTQNQMILAGGIIPICLSAIVYAFAFNSFKGVPHSEEKYIELARAFHINHYMHSRFVFFMTWVIVLYIVICLLARISSSGAFGSVLVGSGADIVLTVVGVVNFFPTTDFEIEWDVFVKTRAKLEAAGKLGDVETVNDQLVPPAVYKPVNESVYQETARVMMLLLELEPEKREGEPTFTKMPATADASAAAASALAASRQLFSSLRSIHVSRSTKRGPAESAGEPKFTSTSTTIDEGPKSTAVGEETLL